tara:strand:+ start:1079 stop:1507 length:429 start_codon:yes stop_codon:yes gene_type:complete
MNISNYTEEEIQAIVGANETRKNKHKVAMKKWYDKKTKLKENATIEDIQALKKDIEKRDNYCKSYYQANKDKIMEKQRLKRHKIRVEKAMMANDKRRQNELLKKELEGKISEVIVKAQEKDELKDIMKDFKEIQAKLKFINE